MMRNQRIGLALSGGGYRATVYHIGTMRALHRLGILLCRDLDVCKRAAMMYSYIVKLSIGAAARFNLNSYGRNCN